MSLDWEPHKYFSVSFPPFRWDGWLEGSGVERFALPSSLGLGSEELVSPDARPCSEEQNALADFRMVSFPLPCEKHEGIFLWHLLWEAGDGPGGNTHRHVGSPCD